MEVNTALEALNALAQETRLWVFRLLVQAGPQGLPAGEIAESLSSRQNTVSSHLKQLQSAGLIDSVRRGRQVVYSANYDTVRVLVLFLVEDCCAGSSQIRNPLVESLTKCCESAPSMRTIT
ncbi:MAG: metalloregulator ArsR/SmtB family transcription factor [Gammaproteobacteria bacterium]|nr:metalloregulator ArsR/SmtB family transcription factor [Gammaproteobacteria bacterium]